MNYDEMSDFEINCAIAKNIGRLLKTEFESGPMGFTESYHEKYPTTVWTAAVDEHGNQCDAWEQSNYCNDPADAWPIIVENRISLFPTKYTEQGWQAEHAIHGVAKDKSPLRAAMIVYLMMQEDV